MKNKKKGVRANNWKTHESDIEIRRLSMAGTPRKTKIKWNFLCILNMHIKRKRKSWVPGLVGVSFYFHFLLGGLCWKVLRIPIDFARDAGQTNIWQLLEGSRGPLSAVWCSMSQRNVIDFKNRRNSGILSVCPQRKKLKRTKAAPKTTANKAASPPGCLVPRFSAFPSAVNGALCRLIRLS